MYRKAVLPFYPTEYAMRRGLRYAWMLMALTVGPGLARAQGPMHVVLLVYRTTNSNKAEAASVVAHCILPASNRYQEIIELQIDPTPSKEYADGEGQRVIAVPLGTIPPGETRAVRVLAWVRLRT